MRNQFLRVPGVHPHSGTCCAITIRMGSNEEKANDMTAACPLAFGETGVKERVRRVLSYKKPAFWVMIAALIVCAAASVCLLTNQSGVALDRVEGRSLRGLYDDISAIEFECSDGESLSQVRTVRGDAAALKKARSALRSISVERRPIAPASAERLRTRDCRVIFIGKRGGTKIYFSGDGSEFFGVRDGGSYTAIYRVRDPGKVTAFIDILKDSAKPITQYPDDTSEKAYRSDSATPQRIAEMREKYPQLFGLDTSHGLYLYVNINGNFDCALFPRPVEKDISLFFDDVEFIPLPHMRIISCFCKGVLFVFCFIFHSPSAQNQCQANIFPVFFVWFRHSSFQ